VANSLEIRPAADVIRGLLESLKPDFPSERIVGCPGNTSGGK